MTYKYWNWIRRPVLINAVCLYYVMEMYDRIMSHIVHNIIILIMDMNIFFYVCLGNRFWIWVCVCLWIMHFPGCPGPLYISREKTQTLLESTLCNKIYNNIIYTCMYTYLFLYIEYGDISEKYISYLLNYVYMYLFVLSITLFR